VSPELRVTAPARTSLALLAAVAVNASCAIPPRPPLQGAHAARSGVVNPFGPAALSIHPLTRVDRDSKGRLWIICHIELRDAWGDTCKGAGKLQVQLYRPIGGRASGLGTQELAWDVDLSDLDKNASFYDPATRTYRLPLEDAPTWLAPPAPGPDEPRAKQSPIARLRAILITTGPRDEERILQDEFTLGG